MSKKLIAVAAAAALALTGLALPANAAVAPTIVVADSKSDTTSDAAKVSTTPATVDANITNTLTHTAETNTTTRTAAKFTVTIPSATAQNIAVTSAGGVKLVTSLLEADGTTAVKPSAGTTTLAGSDSTATNDFVFYAFTTSTTEGTVAITSEGNTSTYYVEALPGAAYNITDVVLPTSVTQGNAEGSADVDKLTFKITDVWGNPLSTVVKGSSAGDVAIEMLGASVPTAFTYSTTRKVYDAEIVSATTTGVSINITLPSVASYVAAGLPAPVKSFFGTVTAGSLAATNAALTTQVAALQAQIATMRSKARSVTKKKYNTLARKWNRANPTDRVALKK